MNGIGKAVWILLWPAAVATPIWWVLGSALVSLIFARSLPARTVVPALLPSSPTGSES